MTEVRIYGPIGEAHGGPAAAAVIRQLGTGAAHVRIHSEGGDAQAAIAIAHAIGMLRQRGQRVEASVEGLAASAATLVLAACEPRRIVASGLLMVHGPVVTPTTPGYRPTDAERSEARTALQRVTDSMVSLYARATGKAASIIRDWMSTEMWFDAREALAVGLVTEIIPSAPIAACLSPRLVGQFRPPAKYRARLAQLTAAGQQRPGRNSDGWARAFARIGGRRSEATR